MSRNVGPKCRLCRRENQKLFLKGERCFSPKCAVQRKNYPPGQHGLSPSKNSEYSRQLREKQKLKRIFDITERQMTNYYKKANKKDGVTGDNLLHSLQLRMDHIIQATGYILSPSHARQLVSHSFFTVNQKRVSTPSYECSVGDIIELKETKKKHLKMANTQANVKVPEWIKFDVKNFKIEILAIPSKEEIENLNVNTQLIVEFYSR